MVQSGEEGSEAGFEAAYDRECGAIAAMLKAMIGGMSEPSDLWRIQEYLTERRDRMDAKYGYRYPVLLFLFARFLKGGWHRDGDLEGL